MNRLITTIVTATLAFSCQLANATSPHDDMPSVVVSFADLDLTHRDGVAMLYRRLVGAAEEVCASLDGHNGHDLGSQNRYKVCRQGALDAAVAKIDDPALTAYRRAQFKLRNATIQVAQH